MSVLGAALIGWLVFATDSASPAHPSTVSPKPAHAAAKPAAAHDFDFLVGDWDVRHRYLRLKGDGREWVEATGTADHRLAMDGWANVEEHTINAPGGTYRAIALRSYDPKTEQWTIWWLDGRDPLANLDRPMKGRFENGIGTFYGDVVVNGTPTPARFIWSQISPTSARWEQAYSADAAKTWETNWIMEFHRAAGRDSKEGAQ